MAGPSTSTMLSHSVSVDAIDGVVASNSSVNSSSSTSSRPVGNGSVNGGCVRGFRSIPPPTQPTMTSDGITFFGNITTKLQMNLNPRYISKVCTKYKLLIRVIATYKY